MPIKKIREVLDADLDRLQEALAWMLEYLHGENVLAAFTSEASALEAAAWPADQEHVRSRLQRMLRDAGLMPGVEKTEPRPSWEAARN